MRIGLVGCGRWGKLILRDLLDLGAEVTVAAPSEATRAEAMSRGALAAVPSHHDLPEADGYFVAVPTALHFEVTRDLSARDKPIFVEKPLTDDPQTAAELLRLAGHRIFVMDKWRYHGGVLKLAELAKSGALGEIKALSSWRLGWGNPHRDVDAVWILAPHDLAICLEILGDIPPVQFASGWAGPGSEAEVTAVLRDREGPIVTMQVSSLQPGNRRSVVVTGSAASAQFNDSYDPEVIIRRPGAAEEKLPIATDMPLKAELQAFLSHIAGGPPPKSSAAEALLIVERTAAIRRLAGLG